jgi:hypothetical protein
VPAGVMLVMLGTCGNCELSGPASWVKMICLSGSQGPMFPLADLLSFHFAMDSALVFGIFPHRFQTHL